MGQEMFRFDTGITGCGEIFLSLLGKMYVGGDDVCYKMRDGLMQGKVEIKILHDTISFSYDGLLMLNFKNDPNALLSISTILENCHKRIEQRQENDEDGNFAGFMLLLA